MKNLAITSVIMMTLLTLAVSSCKKDNPASKDGSFVVRMTDAPADYEELNIEIMSVEAYNENSGWVTLNAQAQSFNVLDLTNGEEMILAYNTQVEAGTYTQLRLRFGSSNSLQYTSETSVGGVSAFTSVTTNLEWNGPQEVTLEINNEVNGESTADILLDFDAASSIIETSETFILDPAIEVMQNATTGIEGQVQGAASAMITATAAGSSASTYLDASGDFLIRGLADGVYNLVILPSAEDVNNGAPKEFRIEGVVVADGQFSNVGTINL